jgi:hypothetical protein
MTPQRWQQVKAILADALECAKPDERAAVVQRACVGDQLLKQEVDALLAHANGDVVNKLLIRVRVTSKMKPT